MKLYNTLSHTVEEFTPINPPDVYVYSCGPTVYDYQHIGHMRRYVGDDILIRVLKKNDYTVHHAMNITDVGHLVSDSDTGEDKMEKGAKKFGKSVWDIAKMFEEQFIDSCKDLNITLPKDLMHATDYIKEQIDLIKVLEEKGFTYRIEDGIYFDTSKFKDYFKFSRQNPEELKKGARVDFVEGKKNVSDFALWKFDLGRAKSGLPERAMNWWFEGKSAGELLIKRPASENDLKQALKVWFNSTESERATIGFPGWHIECSAMSMKALGEHFDIHTGGIDHINIHHTNEIAQSEAATGKKFVEFWVHHNFLVVDGQKMSKSLNNFYTVDDVIKKGFDPLALRYLYLQTHYRQEMNFTWEALKAAQSALLKLWDKAVVFNHNINFEEDREPSEETKNILKRFDEAISDDLNLPKALGIFHEGVNKTHDDHDLVFLMSKIDLILGLDLEKKGREKKEKKEIPQEVKDLFKQREVLRKERKYSDADKIRDEIIKLGFKVEDKY